MATRAKAKIGIFTALLKEMSTRRMLPSSKGMQGCNFQSMTLCIGHRNDPPMCGMGITGTVTKCCVTEIVVNSSFPDRRNCCLIPHFSLKREIVVYTHLSKVKGICFY